MTKNERSTAMREDIVATARRWEATPSADVVAALHNLVQAYAIFTDEGQGAELAGLFTADATWDGTDLGYGSARGPEAIASTVLAHFDPARPMTHISGSPLLVRVSDSEVQGVGWCIATRSTDAGERPLIYFQYHDDFRRDDSDGWRFARRALQLRLR